jgi:hypothetical protein
MKHPHEPATGRHPDWKRGPLPPDTYGWGGVVPVTETTSGGFYFADFQGDKVVLVTGDSNNSPGRTLKPHEVAWLNNSLTLPPAYEG